MSEFFSVAAGDEMMVMDIPYPPPKNFADATVA